MKNLTHVWQYIAELLPKSLVYFATIRLIVYATTGKYSDTVVPEITAMEALKRFGNDFKI